jgi:4-amino-4-deoxychorismate lyase
MMVMMVNGKLIEEDSATVSVKDHGFLYGIGAFETLRIYQNHPFLIEDHFKRLEEACKALHIRCPYSLRDWEQQIETLLKVNGLTGGIARITITGGENELGLHNVCYDEPNTFVFLRPVNMGKSETQKLELLKVPRQAPGGVERLKTSNYLNNIVGRQGLLNHCQTEGLFLTKKGFVAEGIITNVFFTISNTLYTPSANLEILPGITRAFVIEVAESLGYNVNKGMFLLDDLKKADEIFLTNSGSGIIPVSCFEGKEYKAHGITYTLMKEYQRYTTYLRSIQDYRRNRL